MNNVIIKKIFGLEQKEFILLLFFLAIFIFCIYSLIVILIEEKNLFKQLKKYKIIEKHKQEILLILILPIIFLLLVCFGLIDFDTWLGFFGGYFGVLGALGAIWWQKKLDNETAIKNMNLYTNYIIKDLSYNLKENCIYFLTVFSTLNGYDKYYKLNDITKIKNNFNTINNNIINSNFSILLSNKKFFIFLKLKKNLDDLNYYLNKLEEDKTKGNIFSPLVVIFKKFLENNKHNKLLCNKFSKSMRELYFLNTVLLKLNTSYSTEKIKFDEEKIIPKYKYLVQDIIKVVENKDKSILDILNCHYNCVSCNANLILSINGDFNIDKLECFIYLCNVLKMIEILIDIHNNIEKLK